MWDTPSWIGTAIRAKVDERIASQNRASNEEIALQNRLTNEAIAAENRASNERIAAANRDNAKMISDLDRASQELIASARNDVTTYGIDVGATTAAAQRLLEREMTNIRIASNERIAANELSSREGIATADRFSRELINKQNINANLYNEQKRRELTASEGAKTRELTASEGSKNRENQLDIAKLNVAQRVVSDGVRLVPMFVNSSDFKFNGGNGNNTAKSAPATVSTSEGAKSKADALFPSLEPTFTSSTDSGLEVLSKPSTLGAIGALLVSAFSGMASFVPFI